jgi:hypothetical protein
MFVLLASFVLEGALVLNQLLRRQISWFVSRKAGKVPKTLRVDSATKYARERSTSTSVGLFFTSSRTYYELWQKVELKSSQKKKGRQNIYLESSTKGRNYSSIKMRVL